MSVAISGSGTITGLTATGISAEPVFPGNVIQVVNFQTGAYATGTGTIPNDDTIPQNTEGTEFMTLAITPTSATNKLLIHVVAMLNEDTTGNVGYWMTGALFQDSTANAIAANTIYNSTDGGGCVLTLNYYMTAGTTSSTTFKLRAGGSVAGTSSINGTSARYFGGVANSSITIREIAA